MDITTAIGAGIALLFVMTVFTAVAFRIVVQTNEMHIVQSASSTVSYGKDQPAGNVYYRWPSWIPVFGVSTIKLPVSVFDQRLDGYAAYDKGRVPFVIDIMAFFRVTDSNVAAQRLHSFQDMMAQLASILQGAVRTILAQSEIEEILEGRGKFGEMFTKEVDHQLEQWGIQTVKSIELMDIRDANDSKVIANIMQKKKSFIEMESRSAVAENKRRAETAEIEAQRAVKVAEQDAYLLIGQRTADQEREVGISREKAKQAVQEQAALTATKLMAVKQVEAVRAAEITRDVQVVAAEQQKKTTVINAEGHKAAQITIAEAEQQKLTLEAEGMLQQTLKHAQGIEAEGRAKGEAEKAIQLASVTAQTTLAKEIGGNPGYQTYLINVRQIEANQIVGVEQAKALESADVKIIANSSGPVEGIKSVMDLLTPKGGTQLGAMVEAFAGTEAGQAVMTKLGVNGAGAH